MTSEPQTFDYATQEGRLPWWSRIFGVSQERSGVSIIGRDLVATFGPWRLSTPVDNIRDLDIEGPYAWWKVAGPARYSPSDRSLTFATSTRRGVSVSFVEPVAGLDPWGLVRHPSITVTVEDPEALVAALVRASQRIDVGDR